MLFRLLFGVVLGILLSFSTSPSAQEAEDIFLYFYHKQPPFYIQNEYRAGGLSYDTAELLNAYSNGAYNFVTTLLPRKRLNHELTHWIKGGCIVVGSYHKECPNNWVVFWVTPTWGWGPNAENKYLWVELFPDADVIVSTPRTSIEYKDINSLRGYTMAAIHGHKYPRLIEQEIKTKRIKRQDSYGEDQLLSRIKLGRAHFALIQKSAIDFYFADPTFAKVNRHAFFVAPQPFKEFTLQVMIPPRRKDLFEFIQRTVNSDSWRDTLLTYNIQLKD